MSCGNEPSGRADEKWPDRTEISIAAVPSLRGPLYEIEQGIENVDSTLRMSVTYTTMGGMVPKSDSGRFDLILYNDILTDTTPMTRIADTSFAQGRSVLVAGDPLVVVTALKPSGSMKSMRDLVSLERIAMIDKTSLEGRVTEEILAAAGLWDTLRERRLPAGSGRDVIDMITDDRATAGIITGSEARRFEGRVKIVDTLRADIPVEGSGMRGGPCIQYRILMRRGARDSAAAQRMIGWLVHPDIQRVFRHYGLLEAAAVR